VYGKRIRVAGIDSGAPVIAYVAGSRACGCKTGRFFFAVCHALNKIQNDLVTRASRLNAMETKKTEKKLRFSTRYMVVHMISCACFPDRLVEKQSTAEPQRSTTDDIKSEQKPPRKGYKRAKQKDTSALWLKEYVKYTVVWISTGMSKTFFLHPRTFC
jgi:hypothetical protein